MEKDGEDQRGLQTKNVKKIRRNFSRSEQGVAPSNVKTS